MTSPKAFARYTKKMNDRRQELMAEEGAFEALAQHLADKGIRRVFLISGKQTQKLKLYDSFIAKFQKQDEGARCFVWTISGSMPTSAAIEACARECLNYNCEAVVAFGGGAVIDVGKLVAAWLNNPDMSLYQMRGVNCIRKDGIPLYAVSTTCSGAESSACSLVRNDKMISVFYSEYLIPQTVVLDPNLVLRLPMENMASAAILALSHAVEEYISPLSKEFPAERANLLIAIPIYFSFLEKSYKHGAGNDVYLQMMMAPYYTGVASRRIGFGPSHSLSMYVSEKYSVAPGRISAVILPAILKYEFEEVKEDLAVLARAAHLCSARATTEEAADAFIEGFRSLCRRVEMPAELPFIKTEDIGDIIRMALCDARQWGCPKKLNIKSVQTILKKSRYKEN